MNIVRSRNLVILKEYILLTNNPNKNHRKTHGWFGYWRKFLKQVFFYWRKRVQIRSVIILDNTSFKIPHCKMQIYHNIFLFWKSFLTWLSFRNCSYCIDNFETLYGSVQPKSRPPKINLTSGFCSENWKMHLNSYTNTYAKVHTFGSESVASGKPNGTLIKSQMPALRKMQLVAW